ncbi:hypothetical protein VTO73DRAFT_4571 [Trametes versicolor]
MEQRSSTQAERAGTSSPPSPPNDLPICTTSVSSAAISNSGKESSERPRTQPTRSLDTQTVLGSLHTRLPSAQQSRVKMPPSTSSVSRPITALPRSYADVAGQGNYTAPQNRDGGKLDGDNVHAEKTAQNTAQHAAMPQVPAPVADARFACTMTALGRPRNRSKRAKDKSSSSVNDGEGGVQKSEVPRPDGGASPVVRLPHPRT